MGCECKHLGFCGMDSFSSGAGMNDDDWEEQRRIDQQRFSWPWFAIVALICAAAIAVWG